MMPHVGAVYRELGRAFGEARHLNEYAIVAWGMLLAPIICLQILFERRR